MSFARSLPLVPIAVVALALVLPGVALASDDLQPVSTAPDVVVTIDGGGVSPRTVTISAGDVVEWRNRDGERHRMRSRSGPAEFDSGNLEAGQSVRFRFAMAGTYAYLDERDDDATGFHGRVVVQAAGGGGSTGGGGATGGGGSTGGGVSATSATVSIGDDFFSPAAVRIAAGGTVTFRNEGGDEHSATSSGGGPIDSGVLGGGATYRATFPSAGTYAFLCIFHSDMRGTVTVVSPAGGAATPTPTPTPAPTPTPTPDPAGTSAPPDGVAVEAADLEFRAPTVQVAAGGTVTWTNVGQAPHTVTSTEAGFDSGLLEPGATFAQAFPAAGTYAYLCTFHPGMAGTVEVIAGTATASATPSASPSLAATPSGTAGPSPSTVAGGVTQPGPSAVPIEAGVPAASVTPAADPAEMAGMLVALLAVSVAILLFTRVLRGTVRPAES